MRHDFAVVLNKKLGDAELQAVKEDLKVLGWRMHIEAKEEEHILLLALDSETKILEEAENQRLHRDFETLSPKE
jgi:hypothetical protein